MKAWALALALLATTLSAAPVAGRVTAGGRGLPGVRVYPDRQPRLTPASQPPLVLTDGEGRFQLDLDPADAVLVVEKDGWCRDFVPAAEWGRDIALRPEPGFRTEAVTIVRLDFADEASKVADEALRERLFSRRPGAASACLLYTSPSPRDS